MANKPQYGAYTEALNIDLCTSTRCTILHLPCIRCSVSVAWYRGRPGIGQSGDMDHTNRHCARFAACSCASMHAFILKHTPYRSKFSGASITVTNPAISMVVLLTTTSSVASMVVPITILAIHMRPNITEDPWYHFCETSQNSQTNQSQERDHQAFMSTPLCPSLKLFWMMVFLTLALKNQTQDAVKSQKTAVSG